MGKAETELKERYVLNKFTEYPYHQWMLKEIQKELTEINRELSENQYTDVTPWKKELIYRETELIKELNIHIQQMNQVEQWLKQLGENQQNIMRIYALEHGCKNGCYCARATNNTESNVYKTAKRVIRKIAMSL